MFSFLSFYGIIGLVYRNGDIMQRFNIRWIDFIVSLSVIIVVAIFLMPAIRMYLNKENDDESIQRIFYIEQLIREYKVIYGSLPPNPEDYAEFDALSFDVLGYDILDINRPFDPNNLDDWSLYMNCLFEVCGEDNWPETAYGATYVYRYYLGDVDVDIRLQWRWASNPNYALSDFIRDSETVEIVIIYHERPTQLRRTFEAISRSNYANFLFHFQLEDGSWSNQLAVLISR